MYNASTAGWLLRDHRSTAPSNLEVHPRPDRSAASFRSSSSLASARTAGWSFIEKWPGTRYEFAGPRAARNNPRSSKKAPHKCGRHSSVRCGIKSPRRISIKRIDEGTRRWGTDTSSERLVKMRQRRRRRSLNPLRLFPWATVTPSFQMQSGSMRSRQSGSAQGIVSSRLRSRRGLESA